MRRDRVSAKEPADVVRQILSRRVPPFRLPRERLYLHRARSNLGHLNFKQLLQKFRVRTGKKNSRAFGISFHKCYQHFYALTNAISLVGDLLFGR
jgi:hypothetical protein